ncbi:MAG: ATP-binding protein [Micropruina sp.]
MKFSKDLKDLKAANVAGKNPFKPTAGANPPQLVGRAALIDEFAESIENGPGAPGRLTIFSGPRGVGKTVMLNAVAEQVQADHQWQVINETATPGFLGRLSRSAGRLLDPAPSRRHVTNVILPVIGGGIGLSSPAEEPVIADARQVISLLLDQCATHGTGVLITLDEVHTTGRQELGQFAAVVQHLIREDREVAVALAGLPAAVNELLNDELTTFLRRADRHDLGDVPLDEAATSFEATIADNGRTIEPDALDLIARATGGYPFMIQLVGYHVWRKASGDLITTSAAIAGIEQARTRLGSLVHAPALRDLSEVDRAFLRAMSHDDGSSRTADVARRMGKGVRYVSVYRARLIAAGLIAPASYGAVDFALPYLREYLREQATQLVSPQRAVPARAPKQGQA